MTAQPINLTELREYAESRRLPKPVTAELWPDDLLALIDAAEAARRFVVEQDGLVDEVAGDQLADLETALTKFAWNNEP